VSSPFLSHTPHRRRTGGSRGATYQGVRFDLGGVSQLTFWCQGWILDPVIFIFYFVRLPLYNKYSDYIVSFISIHSVIIRVVFFGACMRCTWLCSLKPSVIARVATLFCQGCGYARPHLGSVPRPPLTRARRRTRSHVKWDRLQLDPGVPHGHLGGGPLYAREEPRGGPR
jgi:hypothetical protein